MIVFLTGATGYIGGAVAAALRAHGHTVTGLARSPEAAEKLRGQGIEPLDGDLGDAASLGRGVALADAVIHAGAIRGPAMAETDRAAVEAMLEVLTGSGKAFIYTSGAFVYGDTGNGVVDETHPLSASSIILWRQAVERDVVAAAQRGVRSVVIRVPLVYGNGGSFIIPRFLALARTEGFARYVGSGTNRWSTVHVDDLADLFVRAIDSADAGTTFNAAAGPTVEWREIAEAISRAAGAGGKVASWPVDEARAVFGPYAPGFLENQQLSSARVTELLGWQPQRASVLEDIEHGSYVQTIP
jgi:nucleoside-diphosphate-sugar epimerase